VKVTKGAKGTAERCAIADLVLDSENPRLPPSAAPRSQDELAALLATDYSLLDIGLSIADNGFFEEEPLAAARNGSDGPPYTVIEGNRRLAALKLLSDSALRRRLRGAHRASMTEWERLSKQIADPVQEVPVVMYDNREGLLTFMGYRHITGVQAWDPLAKARFINSLIEDYDLDFREAALRIGSKPAHVKRTYLGYRTYLEAKAAKIDTSSLEKAYGVFTRAMYSPALKEHIGISQSIEKLDDPSKLRRPVPKRKLDCLGELVSWVAGTSTEPAVINDSRQITELGNVVASVDALAVLRATRDLDRAGERTSAPQRRVLAGLERAIVALESVSREITPGIVSDQVIALTEKAERIAFQLRRAVEDAACPK
jgi:hypothetical protein